MKILLYGKNSKNIENTVKDFGFEIVDELSSPLDKNPDAVISYGGDGTLLSSEREFPGIPKLPIRDSLKCIKCANHKDQTLLDHLKNGELKLEEFPKLEADFKGIKLLALNDIVIRNTSPIHAVRFNITKNEKLINGELIIGDGVVFATAFGSTGYFNSITRKSFDRGFALAFNNTIEELETIHFDENDKFQIKIIRGPTTLSEDNNPALYELEKEAEIEVHPADQKARIYNIETLRCLNCQVIREKH